MKQKIDFHKVMTKCRSKWNKLTFHQKLLSVVEQYYEDAEHASSSSRMRCPKCGCYQAMELSGHWWQCLYRDCLYQINTSDIQPIKDKLLSKKLGISIKKINELRIYF